MLNVRFLSPIPIKPMRNCEQVYHSTIRGQKGGWDFRISAYGQLAQLLSMSKQFQVFESSDLEVKTNRDTGEATVHFMNEHKDAAGKPINIPNLLIIAIPVFEGGALYRMPVRFRYRKSGAKISFILKIYNPEKALKAAFDEAVITAAAGTELPIFKGTPEE
ncbi:MAG: DUF2303 family protein [Paracoccaceae bacterium]|uniref:DUF2303 family protein n=1 Tax=Alphaproteobacteria TaxID=28211 RepID=UPI003297695A